MDRIFARNFLLFSLLMTICISGMGYIIVSGDQEINRTSDWITHTHKVIIESEEQSALIQAMVASQRGYLLSGDESFLKQYEEQKKLFSDNLAALTTMTRDNPAQTSRLEELRTYFVNFSQKLEERAAMYTPAPNAAVIKDVEVIDGLKTNIIRINEALLGEEYNILSKRLQLIEDKKDQYFTTLMVGGLVCAIILLILNGFLLNAQSRRSRAERSLEAAEERLALAIEGTNDGIFDWDLRSDSVFYSGQFFKMLGYNRRAYTGTMDDFYALVHPEDEEALLTHIQSYIGGQLSEFVIAFRMKHDSGRWVWINSRATAVFNDSGRAVRMVGAHTDITYMKQYEAQLREEKESAERANQAKTDFLAHMSHEIRTPLTAISGIAEILTNSAMGFDEKQQRLVRTLLTSTQSLKDLVNDILDFSKIENGDIELENDVFSLRELFEQVISMMAVNAGEKGLKFSFDYDSLQKTSMLGDDIRLRQVIINLLSNAIKFTDEGSVNVTAYQEMVGTQAMLCVDVTDTGIGIASENHELVFERFKQGDASVSRKYGGTGLGLPISQNLARLMGGDISFRSEVGKGSTFSLRIPLQSIEASTEQGEDTIASNKLNDKIKAALSGENRILMVEDYEGNIVVMGYLLDDIGCSYDVARTGKQALDLWQEKHYDIILMDIQMPEMDGFTATTEIRRMEAEGQLERTPIIGMTAHALVGDKDKCIDAGMDAYLPKPIVEADLKQKILYYLRTARKAA
ncbi:MAG: response regulator [Alphaproteobacteria bacterium]|nr:response regulator [Alphaproteobacteria bacterium]